MVASPYCFHTTFFWVLFPRRIANREKLRLCVRVTERVVFYGELTQGDIDKDVCEICLSPASSFFFSYYCVDAVRGV